MSTGLYEQIKADLGYLGLDAAAGSFATLAEQARADGWSHIEFLARLVAEQATADRDRRLAARLRYARFPYRRTVDEFDFEFQPTVDRKLVDDLATLRFIDENRPIIFLGQPGCGKTHLAVALATLAVEAGYRGYFTTADAMCKTLVRAQLDGSFTTKLKIYTAPTVLIIDDVGLLPIGGTDGAAAFFHVVNTRHDRQRQANALRHTLRFYYPAALEALGNDLTSATAIGLLSVAPSPAIGCRVTTPQLAASLRRAGRCRNVDAAASELRVVLRREQLQADPIVADAYAHSTRSLVRIIAVFNDEITRLEAELERLLDQHPAVPIIRSIPGIGTLTGGRVLGEFGDDPHRYADARCRKNYAGASPITRASGKQHLVLGRFAGNRRLADACDRWAFCSITASPGARCYYDQLRGRGKTHGQALRQLANRWVGILHVCLDRNHHVRRTHRMGTPPPGHHLTANPRGVSIAGCVTRRPAAHRGQSLRSAVRREAAVSPVATRWGMASC